MQKGFGAFNASYMLVLLAVSVHIRITIFVLNFKNRTINLRDLPDRM